jgi:hypothetical protein
MALRHTDNSNPPTTGTVLGTIRNAFGKPIDKAKITIYDQDLRKRESLGKATTDKGGGYKVNYKIGNFIRAEKAWADVVVTVQVGRRIVHTSKVHFNAPVILEVDITLGEVAYQGPSLWEKLSGEITPLLEDISPTDLREDEKFQDISFISGETERSAVSIGTWSACYHLSEAAKERDLDLPAEFLFAFLRQGQPALYYDDLLNDLQDPERVTLLREKLLRDLTSLGPKLEGEIFDKALEENLVPAGLVVERKKYFAALERIRLDYVINSPSGAGKGSVGGLLRLNKLTAKENASFVKAYAAFEGNGRTFWKTLTETTGLKEEKVQQLKYTFEVAALSRNHPPLVQLIVEEKIPKIKMAAFSEKKWTAMFKKKVNGKPIGIPDNIDGATPAEREKTFAAILQKQFERNYPTAYLGARLNQRSVPELKQADAISQFLNQNERFHLDRFRIDHYLKETPDALKGIRNPTAVVAELKAVQRLFKLNPRLPAVKTMVANGLHSAEQVYFKGQQQFVSLMGAAGINTFESNRTYLRAENAYAYALALFGDLNIGVNGPSIYAGPGTLTTPEMEAKIKALPNLASLFGSFDFCACSHCRSVYGPAAHFVDTMRFLGERQANGQVSTGNGGNLGRSVQEVLLVRRADIGEIELSCENTNTPLPYIDLVNEILEEVVAATPTTLLPVAQEANLVAGPIRAELLAAMTTAGLVISDNATVYARDERNNYAIRDEEHAYRLFRQGAQLLVLPTRQTHLSAAELLANPEYTNNGAYALLANEIYPLSAPFDLPWTESRIYLDRLGVAEPELLELFQGNASRAAASHLGVGRTERQIVTNTLAGPDAWEYWGLTQSGNNLPHPDTPTDTTTNVSGTWLAVLRNLSVFLHRSGLTYAESVQLLDVHYVNPTGAVFIDFGDDPNAANCDVTGFSLRGAGAAFLGRVRRFLPLWRALGMPMWSLDGLLADHGGNINDVLLSRLANQVRLHKVLKTDWAETRALTSPISDTEETDWTSGEPVTIPSLYQRLFRNKAVDALASFPPRVADMAGQVADHVPGLLAALQLGETDFNLLLADSGRQTTDALTHNLLSELYRAALVKRSLRLSVGDFLRVKQLYADDPFASTAALLEFIEVSRLLDRSSFSLAEMDYLLFHQSDEGQWLGPDDESIVESLVQIRESNDTVDVELVAQVLSGAFDTSTPVMSLLLNTLPLPGTAGTLNAPFLDLRLTEKDDDGNFTHSLDAATFSEVFEAVRLVYKSSLVAGRLSLTTEELSWWLISANSTAAGWLPLTAFQLSTAPATAPKEWLRVLKFVAWKQALPTTDSDVMTWLTGALNTGAVFGETSNALAMLAGYDAGQLGDLLVSFGITQADELIDADNLTRIARAFTALQSLGVTVERAVAWAATAPTAAMAAEQKNAVKAKYELAHWLAVIEPLQNKLREQKRDALVAHLTAGGHRQWITPTDLYSYFLIDVEMSACMLSSRLRQATAAVQLFVQRCQLNLEVDLTIRAEQIDDTDTVADGKWHQWAWMRFYRVWEANRKVFLYPENWIEPELRDDKSPYFKELEEELLQNEVTQQTAEKAYLHYLSKLDKVANLEIAATHREYLNGGGDIWHVFARTRSSFAPMTYYRKRINGGRWTAWENTDLETEGRHMLTGLHNKRLFLFWPQWVEKAIEPTTQRIPSNNAGTTIDVAPIRYWEVRMFWSELEDGIWTPKTLTDEFTKVSHSQTTGNRTTADLALMLHPKPHLEIEIFANSGLATKAPHSRRARFSKIGPAVTVEPFTNGHYEHLIAAPNSKYRYGKLQHTSSGMYFYFNRINDSNKIHYKELHQNALAIPILGNVKAKQSYSVLDSVSQGWSNEGSFFFYDRERNYAVDYHRYEIGRSTSHGPVVTVYKEFEFNIHYHPLVDLFKRELAIWGIPGLLNRRIQVMPETVNAAPPQFDFTDYSPTVNVKRNYRLGDGTLSFPVEDVDFSYGGAYAGYNWELFFHAPLHIANKLAANQRFAEALEWYHYIFNPTATDDAVADPTTPQQRFWVTKPFYETTKADYYAQKVENLLTEIANGDAELAQQVEEWRDNPFNPHLIARMRTVAYQKAVVIKYVKTVIAWGDQLFRQNTLETINEATQLYLVAETLLGKRPVSVTRKTNNPAKTFYQLQTEGIGAFGNVLNEVENLLPSMSPMYTLGTEGPELPRLNVLYFCIPNNTNLTELWDTVEDRLYKVRHCMNIDGMVQQLPLFGTAIDPGALVNAAASGGLAGALAALTAPLPHYRFTFVVARAKEMTAEVKQLGTALLSALEKKDAEEFALLRSTLEGSLLDVERRVRQTDIRETRLSRQAIEESRRIVEQRIEYYTGLIDEGWIIPEQIAFGLAAVTTLLEIPLSAGSLLAGSLNLVPSFSAGISGFGGSPNITISFGGSNLAGAANGIVSALQHVSTGLDKAAGLISTVGTYNRRTAEWEYQLALAESELPSIETRMLAADETIQRAEDSLAVHDEQRENREKELEYLQSKFTNKQLYDWMGSQISTLYFQSYQLAFDIAKRAELCYRYEIGHTTSDFIKFGHWDSLKKGLLSGERLSYNLKQLEDAYYQENRREYELTKHVSLAKLDPRALLQLKETGECFVQIPEQWFDMDYPGHYFRRIRSVGLSIPCVTGPYATVGCTLTMTSNQLRTDPNVGVGGYDRDLSAPTDPRFRDEVGAVQSIATSSAQRDPGMFEFSFRDERYLPFEGSGAISNWRLQLNADFPQFDLYSITDAIIHVNYTARDGGGALADAAKLALREHYSEVASAVGRDGLFHVYDLKRTFSDAWYRFEHPAVPGATQELALDDLIGHLPFFTSLFDDHEVSAIELMAKGQPGTTYEVLMTPTGLGGGNELPLTEDAAIGGLHHAITDLAGNEQDLTSWVLRIRESGTADWATLPVDSFSEFFLLIKYTIS